MKSLRRIHTYLGCFFAPLLLFFVGTGWYQTVSPNRHKGVGEVINWKQRLTSVHVDQVYPTGAEHYSPVLFRDLVIVMAGALIVTVILGIILAVRFSPKKWKVWLSLGLGFAVPVLLLWLGQRN